MTSPDHDRDEARLKALFDATASEPDRVQLTKLSARAADVPGKGRRRPFWQLVAPLAALAAGALAVFALRGMHSAPPGVARAPSAVEAPQPTLPAPSAVAKSPAPSATAPVPVTGEAPEGEAEGAAAVAGFTGGDDDSDWLAPLTEPADDDVDAWLAATDAFLEEG